MIYDFLKVQSKNGHTGVRSGDIQQKMLTFVSNYDQAISFLKRNKVVKEEKIEGVPWIFLYHLYKAEEFIATRVTHLLHEQMENRWILDVDFDKLVLKPNYNDEVLSNIIIAINELVMCISIGHSSKIFKMYMIHRIVSLTRCYM